MTFIDEHRDQFAVALLLRVLDIEESTYYGWRKQVEQPCDRQMVDRGLLSNIHDIWTSSGCTYGSDRVSRQLRRDGIPVSRKRVERLMREQDWQGAFLRRGWRTGSTRQDPNATPAPDRVNREFTAPAPNRLWVADATRIPCGEGVFWLAAVRDAFSNRIVGWRCSDRCDTDLILGALEYGIWTRDIREGQLIHHSISETVEAGVPRVLDSHSDGHDRMLVPGAPRVPDPHSDRRTVVFPRICRSLGTPGEALRLAVGVT